MRLAIDTETTGLLDDPTAVVVEVALAGPPGIQFTTLVAPRAGLVARHWDVLTRISHFTVDDLLFAPDPVTARRELLLWYRGLGSPPVDGFCLPFDQEMLLRTVPLPLQWGWDLQAPAAEILGWKGRLSLKNARAGFGLPPIDLAHRALPDARGTWELGQVLADPWYSPTPVLLPGGVVAPSPIAAAVRWAQIAGCSPRDPALLQEIRRRLPPVPPR